MSITMTASKKLKSKTKDQRVICTCGAYKFPHKIGGKCDGSAFAEYCFVFERSNCSMCNCNRGDSYDVVQGSESIEHGECYIDFKHRYPGQHLPLK
jgi:hypothetical protein